MGILKQGFGERMFSWHQPAWIREETLESGNLLSRSWILPPYSLEKFEIWLEKIIRRGLQTHAGARDRPNNL